MTQCCGKCLYWKPWKAGHVLGNCRFPIPKLPDSFVAEDWYSDHMNANEGTGCPCFTAREPQAAEAKEEQP